MEQTEIKPQAAQQPAQTAITQAVEVLAKIEAANRETRLLLERAEALKAEQMLSGKADAGQAPPQPKEETPGEYADKVMRGGK